MLYMAGKRIKKLVRRLGPPVDEEDEGPNVECDEDEEENEPKRLAPNTTFATRLVSSTERTNVRQQCAEPVQSTNRNEGEALIGRISALYGITVAIEPQAANRVDARSILNRSARATPSESSVGPQSSKILVLSEGTTSLRQGKKSTSEKSTSGLMARLGAAPGTSMSSTPKLHTDPAPASRGADSGGSLMSRLGSVPTKDETTTASAEVNTSSLTPSFDQGPVERKPSGNTSISTPADGGGRKRSRSKVNAESAPEPVNRSVMSRLGAVSSNDDTERPRKAPGSGVVSTLDATAKKDEPQQRKRFVPKGVGGHLLLARALGARSRE